MSTPPTLLLADDSVTIQRVVALTFADQAIRVVVARDGQDAINRMTVDRPDVILADTNMPCLDGYELARWVREQPHLSAVPVLLLAGATDPVDEQRLHDSGANGVLEKPFEPSHVISRVKELLGMKSPAPAASARLVTAADPLTGTRVPPRPAPEAPRMSPHSAAGHPPAPAPSSLADEAQDFTGDAPVDELFEAFEARAGGRERPTPGLLARAPGETAGEPPPGGGRSGWFGTPSRPDRVGAVSVTGAREVAIYGERAAEAPPEGFGDAGELPQPTDPTPRGTAAVRVSLPHRAPADVFETLLAAEQGDPAAMAASVGPVVVQAAPPEITDAMLEALAERVSDRLHATIAAGLQDQVVKSVQDSMATEARAAVAEAVQAAVDGSILGTLRGAVNEAVGAAVPVAVERQVAEGVRASAERALAGAVEQSVREAVAGQVAALVRDTVEREMRDGISPLVQQLVREMVGATLQQVVTDAVFAAVPPAVADAVRSEASGQVRQTVHETAERLVSEEIARIRGRR